MLATLILLTLVSGVVDAVSYLGLGHVFVANMTGNVVLLGCAAAGAAGFSVSATLTSLAAFVAGAVVSGRVAGRISDYGRLLLAVMLVEAGLVGRGGADRPAERQPRDWLGPLHRHHHPGRGHGHAHRGGAAARRPRPDHDRADADPGRAGQRLHSGRRRQPAGRAAGRRGVAMLAGAAVGAVLVLHVDAALPLLVAAVLTVGTAAAYAASGAPVRVTGAQA